MKEIIGVKFKEVGKIYYFNPENHKLTLKQKVIVETVRGIECGEIAMENTLIEESKILYPLKSLIRIATPQDIKQLEQNKKDEKEALKKCEKEIEYHRLPMKLIDAEYTFDRSKLIFHFASDGRVDFRALVKDLAYIFKTRIELRQIGVRDEAKLMGGLGICGRPYCCSQFLGDFQPVSIKMAKEQGLSLSPSKISGSCGRLMCCLKYEQEVYIDLLKKTPKVGAIVKTKDGNGTVVDANILTGVLKVSLNSDTATYPRTYNTKDVKLIKDAEIYVNKKELEELKNLE